MIDGDTMHKIIYDVAGDVDVDDSKLEYTPEMHEFREKIEDEWDEWRKDHPDAELYVPPELPEADDE